ncbi:MAG: hypothetical protein IT464_10180 [Planctomycetes bacterium]|nr:hypothetical protein [Planctomycetota bacterium]
MKPTWMLALAGMLCTGALAAQDTPGSPEPERPSKEVKFKNTDADADGKITFDEMKKVHHAGLKAWREAGESLDDKKVAEAQKWLDERLFVFEFLVWDGNDDRELTKEEYLKDPEEAPEITRQDNLDSEEVDFDDLLRHDSDKDGKLSLAELTKSTQAKLKQYVEIAKGDNDKLEKLLSIEHHMMAAYTLLNRDLDGDSVLTREEVKTYMEKVLNREEMHELTKDAMKKYGQFMADTMFTLYDKDGDKALSWDELKNVKNPPSEEEFKKLDKNGDGKLTGEEVAAALTDSESRDGEEDGGSTPPKPDESKPDGGK